MSKRDQEQKCRWDADLGWLTPEHVRDCDDTACSGCRPCPMTHCALRGRCASHVDVGAGLITCPSCIGRVRSDITAIEDLHAVDLPEEAEVAGVESEAFNLVGAAAAPGQYAEHRRRLGEVYEGRGWCDWPRAERYGADDRHHPYLVLGRWDLALREQYGPQTDLFITVTSAADYLRGLLAGPFPHSDEFEEFATEIAACRSHLENVVHDSRTPELGRECPRCVEQNGEGPRLRKRYAVGSSEAVRNGSLDTWHCPDEPEHWWSEKDYRDRVASDYLEHATALTAADLSARLGIPQSTIRRWASTTRRLVDGTWTDVPPKIRPVRRQTDGRKLYRVADVQRVHDGERKTA